MRRLPIFLATLLFAGVVQAQMYKWVGPDGKVRYGDTPPPGVKATSLKAAQSAAPASASAPAAKDVKKGPATPAARENQAQAQAGRSEICDRATQYLRTLESGQRIARTNPSGETYYLDENRIAQEIAKAQQSVQQACK